MIAIPRSNHHPELISLNSREKLTRIVMRLFNEWQLSSAEQLRLLGLRETSHNMLVRYRALESIIPYKQDRLDRIGILLAIYKNLYDLFPENKILRLNWIKRKNKHLQNRTPLDLMLKNGLFGFAHVIRYTDALITRSP